MFDTRSSGFGILCGIQSQQHFGYSLHTVFVIKREYLYRRYIHLYCYPLYQTPHRKIA